MGTTLMPPFATACADRDQQMPALAEANRVRPRRALLMRWIYTQSSAQSHENAAELILEPDTALHSMLTLGLLERVRQLGPAQAERMLARAGITPTCTIGALTSRQRAGLAALLRLRAEPTLPQPTAGRVMSTLSLDRFCSRPVRTCRLQ